jgi:hypothetical protein
MLLEGRFAWMEGVLVLATLAQTWRMQLVPGPPVEPWGLVTLRSKWANSPYSTQRPDPAVESGHP